MKDFKFLFKPLFYIFNILFASWLVIKIEKLHPSDFGRHGRLFETDSQPGYKTCNQKEFSASDKEHLKHLFLDFKSGKLDSAKLDTELTNFFKRNYPRKNN